MAFLVPFIQPVATTAAAYFGVSGAATAISTAVGTTVGPIVVTAATKAAQIGVLYLGRTALSSACEASYKEFLKNCNSTFESIYCGMTQTSVVTSCGARVGADILTGKMLYDYYQEIETPGTKK